MKRCEVQLDRKADGFRRMLGWFKAKAEPRLLLEALQAPGVGGRLSRQDLSLDDAMRRTRDEGFELPQDSSEVGAFRRLRDFVTSSPHLARLANRREGGGGLSVPG